MKTCLILCLAVSVGAVRAADLSGGGVAAPKAKAAGCRCGDSCRCGQDPCRCAEVIVWRTGGEALMRDAREKRLPRVILVTSPDAYPCVPCRKLEAGALSDARVIRKFNEGAVTSAVDGTDPDLAGWMRSMGIDTFPTLVIDGRVTRLNGSESAETILALFDVRVVRAAVVWGTQTAGCTTGG